jgi:ABC-type multidrug transport system fused ATPase/permease subunit
MPLLRGRLAAEKSLMSLGGPSSNRGKTNPHGASLLHFFGVLKYARNSFKYLYVGLACIVVVALTYSLNIMALLPTIQLISPRSLGVPAWIHQSISEHRSGLIFTIDEAEASIHVVQVEDKHFITGEVRRADRLAGVDGATPTTAEMFRMLAWAPPGKDIHLDMVRVDGQHAAVVLHPAEELYRDQLLRTAASWLPQGTTSADKFRTLQIIIVFILLITIVGATCRFFGEYLISIVAARTVATLRKKMYQRVLRLPVSHFATHGISDTVSRFVQDSVDVYRGLNFVFVKSLREPLKALFVFSAALLIDWRITLITVTTAPLAGLIIRRFGKMIRKANKKLLESYGKMISSLEGALTGIRVVKGYTMETYERLRLHMVDRNMVRQQLKIEFIDAISSPIFETVGQCIAALAILYFAQQMLTGMMDFSKFVTLAACMAGMFDPVRKMSSFYNRIQSANAALDRVLEVINLPDESDRSLVTSTMPPFEKSIEFRKVSYTYPSAETPALNNVDLTIHRGELVAIVGPNGSGKTTLASLLMRFFEPDSGTLLLDGQDVREYSIQSVRRQMSLITQDTVMFADTIGNNIAYGDDRLLRRMNLKKRHPQRKWHLNGEEDRVANAAKAAFADEFIREKPQGYDTQVGEHGVTLSGGQKQRISIARAILRNAPIFIFDEATSQIDSESERKIHDAVERFLKGRTALIIAHRFSTIRQANRIVVMDRGRIVDVGSHDELQGRCRLYQSLFGSQIIDDEAETTPNVG